MPIDPMSDRPIFKQIADDLRAAIEDGTYGRGQALPSESQLEEQYGYSRLTVRKAIGELTNDGLITVEHGRGAFVRDQPLIVRLGLERFSRERRRRGDGAFAAETKSHGMTPHQVLRQIGEIDPPDWVAAALGLAEDEKVVVRRRTMYADDTPMQLADSYFPASWARDTVLVQEDTGPGGAYARVEETGRLLGEFTEELSARMPTPKEVKLLRLSPGVPVIILRRTAFDTSATAVEVFDSVVAADKHRFVYTFAAPD